MALCQVWRCQETRYTLVSCGILITCTHKQTHTLPSAVLHASGGKLVVVTRSQATLLPCLLRGTKEKRNRDGAEEGEQTVAFLSRPPLSPLDISLQIYSLLSLYSVSLSFSFTPSCPTSVHTAPVTPLCSCWCCSPQAEITRPSEGFSLNVHLPCRAFVERTVLLL